MNYYQKLKGTKDNESNTNVTFEAFFSGGNIKNYQVSARNIFNFNYYLYICNSKKIRHEVDFSIIPA